MGHHGFIGEFEQMVMLAILQLDTEAFGPRISEELERRAGRRVSRGALYSVLDRLEQKGYLRWEISGGGAERGGHPKRRFEVSRAGIEALRTSRQVLHNLWAGLDDVLGEVTR
jgi:PadR family transcriptional regulator